MTGLIKVFILAGQSNMEGHGFIQVDPKSDGRKGSLHDSCTVTILTVDRRKKGYMSDIYPFGISILPPLSQFCTAACGNEHRPLTRPGANRAIRIGHVRFATRPDLSSAECVREQRVVAGWLARHLLSSLRRNP